MNAQKTHFRRQRRRFPHVQRPPRSRPLTFWPTYRGAVEWIRRNQAIIETAMGLLEIYPALIQERALDAVWDFMAPFLAKFDEKGAKLRCVNAVTADNRSTTTTTSSRRAASNGNGEGSRVPVISITYASDDPAESEFGDTILDHHAFRDTEDDGLDSHTPRVYVCCWCRHTEHEDKLYGHVVHALQHDFYVRNGPCAKWAEGSEGDGGKDVHHHQELREADACVFVLNDSSLNSPACFRDLCAAWTFDLPTLFLKDSNFALPTPLPDVLLQYNLGLEPLHTSRAPSPSMTVKSRHSPSPTPSIRSGRLTKGLSFPPLRASSAKGHRERKRSHEHDKAGLREADLVLMMLNGYRDALVFQDEKIEECEAELRNKLHELLGTGRDNTPYERTSSTSSKSPSTLHPSQARSRPRPITNSRPFLSVPSGHKGSPLRDDSLSSFFSEEDDDATITFSVSPNTISPQPHHYWSDGSLSPPSSRSNSPPPASLLVPTASALSTSREGTGGEPQDRYRSTTSPPPSSSPLFPTSPSSTLSASSAKPSSSSIHNKSKTQSHLSRSFTHLHQFQQQLQHDRATFLSHSALGHHHDDDLLPEVTDGRQTVYMVCSKSPKSPNAEPRLVKYPPSPDHNSDAEEERGAGEVGETLPDVLSDSPLSFRDLDLSVVVNRRNMGTPDSDASTIF